MHRLVGATNRSNKQKQTTTNNNVRTRRSFVTLRKDFLSFSLVELASREMSEQPDQPDIRPVLNLDESTWDGWLNSFILWVAQNPWQFLSNVLLCLSPFFLISLFLSWKLTKAIEDEKKEKKLKAKRTAQMSKARSLRQSKKPVQKES
ncbi:uncharacterized protein LOC117644532 [Thrips palmi]|uniref:Small integral membrane protein 15 n=1 Tax=Thrips palmi TaxID=161013 RepID=A0A6P8ZM46_THRPL|nr:uncharacterized protein LOC117644532 [Thrips palmi]